MRDEENKKLQIKKQERAAKKAADEQARKNAENEKLRQLENEAQKRSIEDGKRNSADIERVARGMHQQAREENERLVAMLARKKEEEKIREEAQRQSQLKAERMREEAIEAERQRVVIEQQRLSEMAARKKAERDAINSTISDLHHQAFTESIRQAKESGHIKQASLEDENAFLQQHLNGIQNNNRTSGSAGQHGFSEHKREATPEFKCHESFSFYLTRLPNFQSKVLRDVVQGAKKDDLQVQDFYRSGRMTSNFINQHKSTADQLRVTEQQALAAYKHTLIGEPDSSMCSPLDGSAAVAWAAARIGAAFHLYVSNKARCANNMTPSERIPAFCPF